MPTFLHKFFISILSVMIFSSLIAAFQITFMNNELNFGLLFVIYSFYTTPVFIFAGVPTSYIIDKLLKKNPKKFATKLQTYIRSISMYGIAGIAIAMVYASISTISSGVYFFSL